MNKWFYDEIGPFTEKMFDYLLERIKMRVKVTTEGVIQGSVIPPSWYPLEVTSLKEDKDGEGAGLDVFTLTIIDGEYKGKMLRYMISEKSIDMGFQYPFYEACLNMKFKKGDPNLPEVEHNDLVGKKIMGLTKRGDYNGKPQDNLVEFRPMKAA